MSHTVTIDLKFKNKEAAVKAAESMNARVIGEGTHRLFQGSHTGLAIQFPGWQFPAIIDEEGRMFYDNYNGVWGDSAQVEKFQEAYANRVIEDECHNLGWYCERQSSGELVIHHPSGGTITVQAGGKLDANGFVGNACEQATEPLEVALGTKLGTALKPYLNEVRISETE